MGDEAISGGRLVGLTLSRFLPFAVLLLAGPAAAIVGPGAISPVAWWLMALQVTGVTAGFLTALFPLRHRLVPADAAATRWHLGSAAVGVLATDVFAFVIRWTGTAGVSILAGAAFAGGLIAAVPLLVTSWEANRFDVTSGDRDLRPEENVAGE